MTDFASYSERVGEVSFHPLSDADIADLSHVEVTNTKQIKNGATPYEYGPYDAAMGGQFNYDCATCEQSLDKCIGHFGSYHLATPVETILFTKFSLKWLRMICIRCSRLIFDVSIKELYLKFDIEAIRASPNPFVDALEYLSGFLKSRKKKLFCDHCNDIREQVERGVTSNSKFLITHVQCQYKTSVDSPYFVERLNRPPTGNTKAYSRDEHFSAKDILIPADKLAIFETLRDEELIKIGLTPASHPKHHINHFIPYPPVNMRFINNGGGRSEGNNYVTSNIDAIMKACDDLGRDEINKDESFHPTKTIREKNQFTKVEAIIRAYNNYLGMGEHHDKTTGIYIRFKGKEGIYRDRGLGKVMANNIFRVVIACKPDIPIDCIYIPRKFAHIMFTQETVTKYNKKKLMKYVQNKDIYPGCYKISRLDPASNIERVVMNNGDLDIQEGDIIFRNVVNGDPILFNRSPTLSTTSYTMQRAIVHEGKKDINYVGLNVLTCGAYNADFDGDAMTGKFVNNEAAREETRHTLNFDRFLIRYETGEIITGLVQDSAIGCALLTTHGVELSRLETMRLFANISINPKLTKDTYTGREIFSMVMPSIDYTAPCQMFKDKMIDYFADYHESDKLIVIKKGQLLSGIVCGKAVKGKLGGIYHIIASALGNKIALDTIYYHQQIIANYLTIRGFTLSYRDLRLTPESKQLIDIVQSTVMQEVHEFNNQLIAGNIAPPIDMSLAEYVEKEMARILNPGSKYLAPILKSVNIKENSLFQLIITGTKGSFGNAYHFFAPVGQLQIDGKRISNTLGYIRFGIYSRQFSLDPVDRGYMPSSFIGGYSARETLAVGQETRKNILTKGLVVSEAGYKGKIIIRAIESAITDHRRFTVRGNGLNIIEFNSLDDGFRSCCSQINKVRVIKMTDAEIKKTYPGREELLISYRNTFLKIHDDLQNLNPRHNIPSEVFLPIDLDQIVTSTIGGKGDNKVNSQILIDYCNTIHYLRLNNMHKVKGTPVVEAIKSTFTMLIIALHSRFDKETIEQYSEEGFRLLLNSISNRIRLAFFQGGDCIGILMGQAFTAPITQYLIDAHHQSAAGGTSKDGMVYCTNIIQKKDLASTSVKFMYIYLKPEYEEDITIVERLASYITSKKLSAVLNRSEIIYERFDEHLTYPEDRKWLDTYTKKMNITLAGGTIHGFKMRLIIDKFRLIAQKVDINELFTKIEYLYGSDIIMLDATDPESPFYIIIIHFDIRFNWAYLANRADRLKTKDIENDPVRVWKNILQFFKKFNGATTINQFEGINGARIKSIMKKEVKGGEIVDKKIYYIETNGVNMKDILLINVVDAARTGCNNVMETYKFNGIAATKLRIASEIEFIFGASLEYIPSVYSIIANVMLETGVPSAMSDAGFAEREPGDTFLRMSISNPLDWITITAADATNTQMTSPTADIIMGQSARHIGTGRDRTVINMDFIRKYGKKAAAIEDEL